MVSDFDAGFYFIRKTIVNYGGFPLYDVSFSITDQNKFEKFQKDNDWLQKMADRNLSKEENEIFKPLHRIGIVYLGDKSYEIMPSSKIGDFIPYENKILEGIELPESDDIRLLVRFSARNGLFYEKLRLKKVNGEWKTAMVVKRGDYTSENSDNLSDELIRKVDSDFPLEENGKFW